MKAKCLMIQGSASHVGKSVVTAALCRIFARKGYRVAPFKAQNMSNNSYVTKDGGEIGRAQWVQAEACGIEGTVDMNPILLKPSTDQKAQIIALGKVAGHMASIADKDYERKYEPIVREALTRLRNQYELILIEGAGSPAEMNLKSRDIVNMRVAKMAQSPVLIVGDIDWGGIFAQLAGTYELLDSDEQNLVAGFIINKFRGDKAVFEPGIRWIEERTGKKVFGVIPYVSDLDLAEEDSIGASDSGALLQGLRANTEMDAVSGNSRDVRNLPIPSEKILIDVLWLPRISNFTDFDGLKKEPDVFLRFLHEPDQHTLPDLLIIPGTKSTIEDLKFLRKSGLADYIKRAASAGTTILGICGGFQMLCEEIRDPEEVESSDKKTEGLALIPGKTVFAHQKTVTRIQALHSESGCTVQGYEIHMGQTILSPEVRPFLQILGKQNIFDGAQWVQHGKFSDTKIIGTYLHGLFDNSEFRRYFLNSLGRRTGFQAAHQSSSLKNIYDHWADIFERHVDIPSLENLIFQGQFQKIR